MAEEVANASRAIPRAIMLSIVINGTLGFGMLIAVLFCMGDLEVALNSNTGYPYIEIFYQATNSVPGTLAMVSVNLIISVCSVIGMLAATSRQFWSFARDRGIPGWRWWSHVSTRISSAVPRAHLTSFLGFRETSANLFRLPDDDGRVAAWAYQHRLFCRSQ